MVGEWKSADATLETVGTQRNAEGLIAPAAHYTYTVDGRKYHGANVGAPPVYMKSESEALAQLPEKGGTVTIQYRVGMPEYSYVTRDRTRFVVTRSIFWGGPLVLLLVGLGLLAWPRRRAG